MNLIFGYQGLDDQLHFVGIDVGESAALKL